MDLLQFAWICNETLLNRICTKISKLSPPTIQIMRNYAHFELFSIPWGHFMLFWLFCTTPISQVFSTKLPTRRKLSWLNRSSKLYETPFLNRSNQGQNSLFYVQISGKLPTMLKIHSNLRHGSRVSKIQSFCLQNPQNFNFILMLDLVDTG